MQRVRGGWGGGKVYLPCLHNIPSCEMQFQLDTRGIKTSCHAAATCSPSFNLSSAIEPKHRHLIVYIFLVSYEHSLVSGVLYFC